MVALSQFRKPKSTTDQPAKIGAITGPLILERYVAIADYEKQKKHECSVKAGQTVEVIDKNENGEQPYALPSWAGSFCLQQSRLV